MKYELFDIAGIIWGIGVGYLFLCLLSQILFGKMKFMEILQDIFLISLWPLLLISPNGRNKIVNLTKIL